MITAGRHHHCEIDEKSTVRSQTCHVSSLCDEGYQAGKDQRSFRIWTENYGLLGTKQEIARGYEFSQYVERV